MTESERDGQARGDPEPNARQQQLIDGTEGIYLVDAGAGTGKTLAVTRRYAKIGRASCRERVYCEV